ncbi:MAG: hypothetical protein JXA52_08550 [Planctomycetes bacterium]|nr:hypothetical protein [Planctomycetota bacterium]
MSEDVTHSDESKQFEAGLKQLLRSAYHPPEPSEEFKAALLTKLKVKQAELVSARDQKRRSQRVTYLSTAMAVAASFAFILGINIFYQQQENPAPAPSLAPVVAINPVATNPQPVSWSGEITGQVDASWNNEGFAPVSNTIAFKSTPVKLRTSGEQAGVELAPGARMVMDKDSLVSFKDGRLQVDHGKINISLSEDATPLNLALPYHEINIQPGSRIDLKLEPAALYALGGRPAPDVTLLEGFASIRNHLSESTLLPGKTYRLYNYPALTPLLDENKTNRYPSRADSWIAPTFVNFQTTQTKP